MTGAVIEAAEAFAAALSPGRALVGLDLGTKTIGVAVSDPDRKLATGIETVARTTFTKDAARLLALASERSAAGYYKGTVDGVIGRKTKQAIMTYQAAVGLEPDGRPSSDLAEHIRYTREVAEAALFTGTIQADPEAETRATVRRVQTGLAELAYSPGEINGELTRQTRNAILAFQQDRKLPETGEISDDLVAELGKMSGQSELTKD